LKISTGIDCGIHLAGMQELCRFVAEASSSPIHVFQNQLLEI